MKRRIKNTIEEAKSKLGGYVALYSYHLMNLVIKADPVALLGVNVMTEEGDSIIEGVADVLKPDDYHFYVVPKEQENLVAIGKGILETHPEMKQEVRRISELINEEPGVEEDETENYILLSMPEVDDDRYKVLKDGVESYSELVKTKTETVYDFYKLKVEEMVMASSQEEKDEAKAALEELSDMSSKTIEEFKQRKLTEIEEAYKKYLEAEEEKQTQQEKEEKAHGKSAGMSMKLYGEEDDE